ncbi:hypothetical protein D3C87_1784840 [compost metagenome]
MKIVKVSAVALIAKSESTVAKKIFFIGKLLKVDGSKYLNFVPLDKESFTL